VAETEITTENIELDEKIVNIGNTNLNMLDVDTKSKADELENATFRIIATLESAQEALMGGLENIGDDD